MSEIIIDHLNHLKEYQKIHFPNTLDEFVARFSFFVYYVNEWTHILAHTLAKQKKQHPYSYPTINPPKVFDDHEFASHAKLCNAIIKNLADESDDGNGNSHTQTFVLFIRELDPKYDQNISANPRNLCVHIRNIHEYIDCHSITDCFLMLGAIEYVYAFISGEIVRAITEKYGRPNPPTWHYQLHEKLDIDHALLFFNALPPSSLQQTEDVKSPLCFGVTWIYSVINDLLATTTTTPISTSSYK